MGAVVRRAVAGAGKTSWLVERYVELVVDAAEPDESEQCRGHHVH